MNWRAQTNMKIGVLCYAVYSGLGILARDFHRHGLINRVLRVDHPHYQNHPEWYPSSASVPYQGFNGGLGSLPRRFIDTLDVLLILETPYDWSLLDYARSRGVRSVFMPMHEYAPETWPAQPDLILSPSLLEQRLYPGGTFLPVPVDTEQITWQQRDVARVYVHNAGHGGVQGRNGMAALLEAMPYVKSPLKLIVRSQNRLILPSNWKHDQRVELRCGDCPYEELWQDGDVFVFPERFNGLSLPLQEAHAAGMAVMATDRFPMNAWLPKEVLIPACGVRRNRVSSWHQPFDEAVVNPVDIARTMDDLYGQDISELSQRGRDWAEANSWETLGPRYLELLQGVTERG